MKKILYFFSMVCILCISQSTFAQPATFYDYRWSPDGSRFVVMFQNDTTVIATLYDDQWQPLASRQVPSIGLQFSPDGDSLLVSGPPTEIWDTDTLQTLKVLPFSAQLWSPDGNELTKFDSGPPGNMKIYSATDGHLLREFTASTAAAWGWPNFPLLSPNGDYFVMGVSNQLVLLDAITGQQVGANYQLNGDINSYSWSSDVTRIAISLRKQVATEIEGSFPVGDSVGSYALNSTVLLELATGTITTLRGGFRNPAPLLLWSPDDKYIASWFDGYLHIMDSANGNLIDSFNVMPNFGIIGWSPDGGRLMMGLYSNASYEPISNDITAMSQSVPRSTFVQNQLDGLIQLFVPAASPERLQSILAACSNDASLKSTAATLINSGQYEQFIARLDTATNLPASCAADLRLMAEAIASEQGKPIATPKS